MRTKSIEDFSEGDGFNSPRIDGFDILHERIANDMDVNPECYTDMEHDLFARYDHIPESFKREMEEYLAEWIDREYNSWLMYY